MKYNHEKIAKMLKGGKRPKGMSYSDYSEMMKGADEEPMDQDDYESMDEAGEEEDDEDARKSVAADDLQKALDDFDVLLSASDPNSSRREKLENKFRVGTLSKSEQSELARLWQGKDTIHDQEDLFKSMEDRIDEYDDDSGELVDASPFLQSLIGSVDDALETVSKSVYNEARTTRQAITGMGVLLKSTAAHALELGNLVQSLQDRLSVVETTPAAPRGITGGRPVARRFVKSSVDSGDGEALAKSELFKGLRLLAQDADKNGDAFVGEQVALESARLESTGQLSDRMLRAVRARLDS